MSSGKQPERPPEDRAEFVNLFKKGLKFTEELLAENEKLRFRVASLEAESETLKKHQGAPSGDAHVEALKRQLQELERERASLLQRYAEVETENRDYQTRYAEIEEEHNNLANLYIASYQLHSSLSFPDVVQVVSEIVINLVGVSRFALYLHDAGTKTMHPIFTEGHDAPPPVVTLGEGFVGKAVLDKQRLVQDDGKEPLAVIPLATLEELVGAIVIDKLLVQKQGFSAVDHELFTLLGAHAATALLSALLRERVGDDAAKDVLAIARARALLGR
jgi:hypothetical protein